MMRQAWVRVGATALRGRMPTAHHVRDALRMPIHAGCLNTAPWTRCFSDGVNGNDLDEDPAAEELPRVNGAVSPLERLMQHSKQYRDDVGLEDLPHDAEDELFSDVPEPLDDHEDATDRHDDDDKDITPPQPQKQKHQQQEEEEGMDAHSNTTNSFAFDDWTGDDDEEQGSEPAPRDDDGSHHRSFQIFSAEDEEDAGWHSPQSNRDQGRRHPRHHDARGLQRHTRGRDLRASAATADRVRRQLLRSGEIDFQNGLSQLDQRRARERMYDQLLTRDFDRERICQNCGERGHVARNCLLPTICSNCGDIGHRRHECPHPLDDVAEEKHRSRRQAYSWLDEEEGGDDGERWTDGAGDEEASHASSRRGEDARPLIGKPEDPVLKRHNELRALGQRHHRMKKAFDEELDEYLDHLEARSQKRKEKKRLQPGNNDEGSQ